VLATVASTTTRHAAESGPVALTAGFHSAFLVGAAFALAGAVTAAVALGRLPRPVLADV